MGPEHGILLNLYGGFNWPVWRVCPFVKNPTISGLNKGTLLTGAHSLDPFKDMPILNTHMEEPDP